MIEVLQTPWIADVRRSTRNRGRGVMRLGAVQLGAPPLHPENSLFGRTNPCSGQNDSLFPEEQGIGLQAAESAWRPAPKTVPKSQNWAKFSKIPC
jgi:hypothetical protein